MTSLIKLNQIEHKIYVVRGHRIMIDADLATLYPFKAPQTASQKEHRTFSRGFFLRLTLEESRALAASSSQSVIIKKGHNIKYASYAFRTGI